MSKKTGIKKPSKAIQEAQWRLDSAVVRGKTKEEIDKLREELHNLVDLDKMKAFEKKEVKKRGIAKLDKISDAIRNFR